MKRGKAGHIDRLLRRLLEQPSDGGLDVAAACKQRTDVLLPVVEALCTEDLAVSNSRRHGPVNAPSLAVA